MVSPKNSVHTLRKTMRSAQKGCDILAKQIQNSSDAEQKSRKGYHPRTPKAQEQRMINLAMAQAEKMLEEGHAPAQIVMHFLRLATEESQLSNRKLKSDIKFTEAKSDMISMQQRSDELYEKALIAFKDYGGASSSDDEIEDDD